MLPLQLKLTSFNHCYIELPELFVSRQPTLKAGSIVSIKSVQSDRELLVIWNGRFNRGNFAQLDLTFGTANKFNDELIVLSLPNGIETPDCSLCRVELVTSSDYTMLNQHQEINLLNTCKLVFENLVIPIWLSQNVRVLVKVLEVQPNSGYALLTKWTEMMYQHTLEKASVEAIGDENTQENIPIVNPIPLISSFHGVGGYKPKFVHGALLVCGERGSGKTHFLKTTLYNYRRFHGELFNCKQLQGKRPENIKKIFNELLTEAFNKQPFLLALDDIDSIVTTDPKHEDERGQDEIYRKRLVEALSIMFKQLERSNHIKGQGVMILASCRCFEQLDDKISKPKGREYFCDVIRIGNLSLEERTNVLKNILAEQQVKSNLNSEQLEEVARNSGSCSPSDLRRLVERGIINACSRSSLEFNTEPIVIQEEDLVKSLADYTPINLRGVSLEPKSQRTFACVGGMKKIKEELKKTILMRIKYPQLYRNCPMQLQSSILLYGPPGCGKTLVAEALTNEHSINSICIHGPELFSKYIGASEAAVRDLFRRAELAKPCVIFLDELDSLVSKRGADSTGVTDRIVNQFLTLMDGVERLSSDVFILAATSRPDMIDPAIMRPGRLDKHIYCPIPNQEDRLDILRVLSKGIEFENLEVAQLLSLWSHKLEGFTGADIQSFLYSAQLKALHSIVGPSDSTGNESGHPQPTDLKGTKKEDLVFKVNEAHLQDTFDEMRKEIESKYVKFITEYPANMKKKSQRVAARATLA